MLTKLLPRGVVAILAPEPTLPLYKDNRALNQENQSSILSTLQAKLKEIIVHKSETTPMKVVPTRKASIV
jgi:hypothetical protein